MRESSGLCDSTKMLQQTLQCTALCVQQIRGTHLAACQLSCQGSHFHLQAFHTGQLVCHGSILQVCAQQTFKHK